MALIRRFTHTLLFPAFAIALAGCSGEDGAPGPAGPAGEAGVDGEHGLDGEDGKDGIDGEDGADGKDGVDGENGVDGEDGAPGEPGADGVDGEDGAPGEPGADGVDGLDGEDGHDGVSGQDGQDGADGQDASNSDVREQPTGRLAFADASTGGVRVLDLETGLVVGTIAETAAGASLYTTESGRFIAVVENPEDVSAERVLFIDSGAIMTAEGERTFELPRLLDVALVATELDTANPVHFVSHGGYITVHFDGVWDEDAELAVDAANFVFPEASLLDMTLEPLELRTESQHGVSVVSLVSDTGHVVLTAPTQSRDVSTLPSGVNVYDLEDGELLQTIQDEAQFESSCLGLHGEAAVGDTLLFGCHERFDGGILVLDYDEDINEYVSRKIRYPGFDIAADPRAPARTSVMTSHSASPYALGQFGHFTDGVSHYSGLVRIDPAATDLTEEDTLDLGSVYCSFGFEQELGELAVAFTQDGRLHVADIADWSQYRTLQAMPAGDGTCPGRMAIGNGFVYLMPTGEGLIYEIELATLDTVRIFDVGGSPSSLTFAYARSSLE